MGAEIATLKAVLKLQNESRSFDQLQAEIIRDNPGKRFDNNFALVDEEVKEQVTGE